MLLLCPVGRAECIYLVFMIKEKVTLFWFRRDLRLHDNHGLYKALTDLHTVLPVFIFDQHILEGLKDKADRRIAFIHTTLSDINVNLRSNGSSLYVLQDTPLQAFKKLTDEFDVQAVYANHDYEPYSISRDAVIADYLGEKNIAFHTFRDQVIFEKADVVKQDGSPYTVFTPYAKAWKAKYLSEEMPGYPSEKFAHQFFKTKALPFLSLRDIGFREVPLQIPPVWPDKNTILQYEETRNFPALKGTSRMSIHLRFGTTSIRLLADAALKWNETWLNELIWREFFMMILFHFPRVVTESFRTQFDQITWLNDETSFQKWCAGETGYPLVDAGMRELNATGFMHNRVRMVVASFLTKHLLIDWRWGEAYFAEKLFDFELSSNNGNWQWCAGCGCDAAPYFRIFNPVEQQKKFDPDFVYIRKWIKDFAPGYIEPIVEHDFARKRALEVFRRAFSNELP
jgi:deoxyribodipyrimidine photo-lyase